jgi:hypothetical protein
MAQKYENLSTADLEAEAQARGIDLTEFQGLANNKERAQRLRDHDDAVQAGVDQAQQNADNAANAARQAQAEQGQADDSLAVDRGPDQAQRAEAERAAQSGTPPAQDTTTRQPGDPAPYVSDEDLRNRLDAASGTTQYTQQPEGDVPEVGGQANHGGDTRDDSSEHQQP